MIVRALVKNNGRYLLVKRSEDTGFGEWQFPGGHIDNDTPSNAIKREVREETGISITDLKRYMEFINPMTKKHTIIYKAFPQNLNQIKPQEGEVSDIGFFYLDEIKQMNITPGTFEVIKYMRK